MSQSTVRHCFNVFIGAVAASESNYGKWHDQKCLCCYVEIFVPVVLLGQVSLSVDHTLFGIGFLHLVIVWQIERHH